MLGKGSHPSTLLYLVKNTIDKPSDSSTFSLKSRSVIANSSLLLPIVIGCSSLTAGLILMTSCPGTEDAMEGNVLAKNLGIPNNLYALLVEARMATIMKNMVADIFRSCMCSFNSDVYSQGVRWGTVVAVIHRTLHLICM